VDDPFYQPPMPRQSAVRPERACRALRLARGMIRNLLADVARGLLDLPGRRDHGRRDSGVIDPIGRDVLWRAKCNALHRALLDHDLSTPEARTILCRLSAARNHGCELARLERLTGLDAGVLDRVVPLLGLQNFISVRETSPEGCSDPSGTVLWVSATEHGLRYAAEILAALSSGQREPVPEETA